MWKLIKIANRSYLISCIFGDNNEVTFILYDQNESWCEIIKLEELKHRAKQLNRRCDFNEDILRQTLMGNDGSELADAIMDPLDGWRGEPFSLKLKYRVKNCPFHYEWFLKKQTMPEVHTTFVTPLCSVVMGYQEQIEILKETLKKKDAEILQYRKEGAILSRKTVATKLFDFDEFSRKYEANKATADFSEFGKLCLSAAESTKELRSSAAPRSNAVQSPKVEEKITTKPTATPISPGQRKRKIQELKQKHLERNMKNRKQNIVYESQSQGSTTGSSQSSDMFEEKKPESKNNATSTKSMTVKMNEQQSTEIKFEQIKPETKSNTTSTKSLIVKPNDKKPTEKLTKTTQKSSEEKQQDKIEEKFQVVMPFLTQDKQTDSKSKSLKNKNREEITITPTKSICQNSTILDHNYKELPANTSIDIDSDSDINLTPRNYDLLRMKGSSKANRSIISESDTDDTIKDSTGTTWKQNKSFQAEKEQNEDEKRNDIKQKAMRCLAFNDVVDISTDSDASASVSTKLQTRRYPGRRNTTCTPTKSNRRVTRSSPQVANNVVVKEPRRRWNSLGILPADIKIFDSTPKKDSAASSPKKTLIVGEISSQLDAIRKELQSLEALRLADLKQRTCKA